ncbi:triphosphoribosyl-dephospho-CoA synthase [Caldinitratiruptor microaerophilus]|uniref:Triphosphoribosyl-dephospho-CoA synthase n=1 Tax=Caldinitratiruptor microaerophilus TaxID=671077 RepID=A0AA35G5Z9_9FIRM|nr:triphosphoribosyl-dephospho-CoA synthase [Caldinitratiruptor microaerophilus]BDG60451.1 triphosphoribosyl-dephospho-CoA synthase [Caldinitratiruptor microaerophilus]
MTASAADRATGAARRIEWATALACILEASAEKPGNVTPTRGFADVSYPDFVTSALAIAPVMAQAVERRPGQLVLEAVRATRRVVQANTNLGIVLLLAPLARAYARAAGRPGADPDPATLRRATEEVLGELTVDDARLAYEAIRLAAPGGLGAAPDHDVREEPQVNLREAMAAAAGRDHVAGEYATGYGLTFDRVLPALEDALAAGLEVRQAVAEAFLRVLATTPDTLIARKLGPSAAAEVSERARWVLVAGGVRTRRGRAAMRSLDRFLRDPANRRNPGTTADLVAAGLFVHLVLGRSARLHPPVPSPRLAVGEVLPR